DCDEALRINPRYVQAYVTRGQARWSLADASRSGGLVLFSEDAFADFAEALRIDPKADDAYATRGELYRRDGRFDEAIADCDRAIELNFAYAFAYVVRGRAQ